MERLKRKRKKRKRRGMKCPYCGNNQTEVVETRDNEELQTIRRRRACVNCGKRFTTYERVENVDLYVIKKDGRRELFNRDKLKRGMLTSTEKTKISVETVEKLLTEIERELRGRDSVEVKSKEIGDAVAKQLKKLDKVAYIRFASVFKRFVDVEDFEKEVKKLVK
jgi:transcriptional repressor NrdR